MEVAIEKITTGASWPWNFLTVPTWISLAHTTHVGSLPDAIGHFNDRITQVALTTVLNDNDYFPKGHRSLSKMFD